jgi:transcription elongation GreA/GreB family factor
MADKKRINTILNQDDYKSMLDQVKKFKYKNITALIVDRCTKDPHQETKASEVEQVLRESLDRALKDLDDLRARYDLINNALLWHTLPFWKKLGKAPLEIGNK